MKKRVALSKLLLALLITASIVVSGLPMGTESIEVKADTTENEAGINGNAISTLNIVENQPIGGWEPIKIKYIEDDSKVSDGYEEFVLKNTFNADQNSVFNRGAGHVGYDALGSDALNSDAIKAYYSRINNVAMEFMQSEDDVTPTFDNEGNKYYVVGKIWFNDLGLTTEQAFQAYMAYDYDHPGYYWISNSVTYSGAYINMLTEEEYASASNRIKINKQIADGVLEYVSMTNSVSDTLDKIQLVHDKIITTVDYAYKYVGDKKVAETAKWAHSVQGVFDPQKHSVVCEGYADAFSLIMNYLGIPNYYIVGKAYDSELKNLDGHAWNLVSPDGGKNYMYMDLTWDDLGDTLFYYYYFGMPKSEFEIRHIKYDTTQVALNHWLYDISSLKINDSFEGTYYYNGGLYVGSKDLNVFSRYAKTKASRFGNLITILIDDEEDEEDDEDYNETVNAVCGIVGCTSYINIEDTLKYKGKTYDLGIIELTNNSDLSGSTITLPANSYVYTGSDIKPVPTVTCNGVTLLKDINYEVLYEDNKAVGDNVAKVIVNGIGNFEKSCSKTFTIVGNENAPGMISTAKVTLQNDITLNLYAEFTSEPDQLSMTVAMNGKDYSISGKDISVNGSGKWKYEFTFEGICPDNIADNLVAVLNYTVGGTQYQDTLTYSIKKYCMDMLNKSDAVLEDYLKSQNITTGTVQELKTLLVDILYYGAESQKYVNANVATDELATKELTDAMNLFESKYLTPTTGEGVVTNDNILTKLDANAALKQTDVNWYKANVNLKNTPSLQFFFKVTSGNGTLDNDKLTINGNAVLRVAIDENNTYETIHATNDPAIYYVEIDKMSADSFRNTHTAVIYKNDAAVNQMLTYSMNTYVSRVEGDANFGDLAKRLYNYGKSAYNFAN